MIDLSHYGGLSLDKKWKYCEWIVMRYEILERISQFTVVSDVSVKCLESSPEVSV